MKRHMATSCRGILCVIALGFAWLYLPIATHGGADATAEERLLREKPFEVQAAELEADHLVRVMFTPALPNKSFSYVIKVVLLNREVQRAAGGHVKVLVRSGDGRFTESERALDPKESAAICDILYTEELLSLPARQVEVPEKPHSPMVFDAGTQAFDYFNRRKVTSVSIRRVAQQSGPLARVAEEFAKLFDDLITRIEETAEPR